MNLEMQIVELLQAKDKKAIDLIYKNYASSVFGLISKSIKDQQVAEEVLQDVFLKIWKFGHKYDASKGRFYTWLVRVTRNTVIDKLRSGGYQRSAKVDCLEDFSTFNKSLSQETIIHDHGLFKVIKSLPYKYFCLIELVYFHGYTHAEVSKELDIPMGTIKTRLRAAITILRDLLGDEALALAA